MGKYGMVGVCVGVGGLEVGGGWAELLAALRYGTQ